MTDPGQFLIVEDDLGTIRALSRILGRYRGVVCARTVDEGRVTLGGDASVWTGLVVDVGLPDGSGLEIVRVARAHLPVVPVLVLTGRHDPPVINRSHQLRAEFCCKPASEDDVVAFARRAVALERIPNERLALVVDEFCRERDLTPREVEVVLAAQSNSRGELSERLGVSRNTLKSLVRSLLGKTRHESLASLTQDLLRAALEGGGRSSD